MYAHAVARNSDRAGRSIKSLRPDPPEATGAVSINAMISSDGDFDNDGMEDPWEVVNELDPSAEIVSRQMWKIIPSGDW
jgi:hypothetical protein